MDIISCEIIKKIEKAIRDDDPSMLPEGYRGIKLLRPIYYRPYKNSTANLSVLEQFPVPEKLLRSVLDLIDDDAKAYIICSEQLLYRGNKKITHYCGSIHWARGAIFLLKEIAKRYTSSQETYALEKEHEAPWYRIKVIIPWDSLLFDPSISSALERGEVPTKFKITSEIESGDYGRVVECYAFHKNGHICGPACPQSSEPYRRK